MHKLFGIVFMCIFALTHHLPTISASASDLSLSSSSSSPSSSSSSHTVATSANIATAVSGDVSAKATDLFAIENDVAVKDTSIAASSTAFEKLATRRQTRSLFYIYPFGGLYNNLYAGYRDGFPYYPFYSYSYYPTIYKNRGGYNPYYPSVIYG